MRKINKSPELKNRLLPEEVANYTNTPLELLEIYYPDNREDICVMSNRRFWTPSYDSLLYTTGFREMTHMQINLYWKRNDKVDHKTYSVGENLCYYNESPKIKEFEDCSDKFRVEYSIKSPHWETITNHVLIIPKDEICSGFDGYVKKMTGYGFAGKPCKVYSYITDSKGKTRPAKRKIWEPW